MVHSQGEPFFSYKESHIQNMSFCLCYIATQVARTRVLFPQMPRDFSLIEESTSPVLFWETSVQ